MDKDTTVQDNRKQKIDAIEPGDERLTSRSGWVLLVQYLQGIGLTPIRSLERRCQSAGD